MGCLASRTWIIHVAFRGYHIGGNGDASGAKKKLYLDLEHDTDCKEICLNKYSVPWKYYMQFLFD